MLVLCFFFFKQKTAYEMRISDWSSDVCSSDLQAAKILLLPLVHERLVLAGDIVRIEGGFGFQQRIGADIGNLGWHTVLFASFPVDWPSRFTNHGLSRAYTKPPAPIHKTKRRVGHRG